jgi:hypothetical protein
MLITKDHSLFMHVPHSHASLTGECGRNLRALLVEKMTSAGGK